MDREKVRKDFLKKYELDIYNIALKRHEQLIRKLSEHKYGVHKDTKGERDAR